MKIDNLTRRMRTVCTVNLDKIDANSEQLCKTSLSTIAVIAMPLHFRVFDETTYRLIKAIVQSTDDGVTRRLLQAFCKYEAHEAAYVQVAVSCLFLQDRTGMKYCTTYDRSKSPSTGCRRLRFGD